MQKKNCYPLSLFTTTLIILLISGCGYRHKLEPELEKVRKKARKQTGYDLDWNLKEHIKKEEAEKELSFEAAITNAILTDPDLRARFQDLGISQADLAQAGFFTNPYVASFFEYDRICNDKTYTFLSLTMNISDLWQIPFKKRVARDDLMAATLAALARVVDITAEARTAYYTYLYEQYQVQTTEKILNHLKELRNNLEKNYSSDYISDYDRNITDGIIATWELKKLEQEKLLYAANTILRDTIGIDPATEPINITNSWESMMRPLPKPKVLFEFAQKNNPNMQILKVRIEQAKHQESLSRSKIIDNVAFGPSWSQDQSGNSYWGPVFNFSIPLFDQQQNQIERARKTGEKLHNDIATLESVLTITIYNACNAAEIAQKKIDLYKKLIPAAQKKSTEYVQKHADSLHLNFVVVAISETELLQQEYILNREYLNLALAIATLEKQVGGKIPYELIGEPTPQEGPEEKKIEEEAKGDQDIEL